MKKRQFLAILSNFGIFSKLWLFIMNRRLFISFLAFLSHWRLRKTNRWLRNKKKTVFRPINQNLGFLSFFSIFESLAASEYEQVAS